MIDMGSAKNMKTKSGVVSRTYSIIGTPHYMAPEIISGKGYSFPADIWSVGNNAPRNPESAPHTRACTKIRGFYI